MPHKLGGLATAEPLADTAAAFGLPPWRLETVLHSLTYRVPGLWQATCDAAGELCEDGEEWCGVTSWE